MISKRYAPNSAILTFDSQNCIVKIHAHTYISTYILWCDIPESFKVTCYIVINNDYRRLIEAVCSKIVGWKHFYVNKYE